MLICCQCGKKYDSIQAELEDRDECSCGGGLVYPTDEVITESPNLNPYKKERPKMASKKRVPKHIQADVDEYIEVDAQVKNLLAHLKKLRSNIEPYMHAHNITVIPGSIRGSISLKPREMAPTTARYSSYDVDGVVSLLDNKAKKEAIVQVVDKDVLDLLVKTGKAPAEVSNYKITKPSMAFSISHK